MRRPSARAKPTFIEIVVPEGEFEFSIGGGQPGAGAPQIAHTFRTDKSLTLPE